MTDLEEAAKQWAEARQAIFAANADPKNADYLALWEKLSDAEHALMDIAKTLTGK